MRVCLCAIIRDADPEHAKLAAMLDSAAVVGFTDHVIAIDSRSIDGTEAWLRARLPDADIFTYEWRDDFAWARNLTLARVPAECAFWGWADSDDTIVSLKGKTIPALLEELRPEIGAVFFDYDYLHDEYGNRKTTHLKGRLFRTSVGWEWKWRLHEDVHPTGGRLFRRDIQILRAEDEFEWIHHPDKDHKIDPERNFRILKLMLEENPDDTRTWYLLGNQHFAAHHWQLAIEAYERYVEQSGWELEKWAALIYIAIAARSLAQWDKAIEADTRAMHLFPDLADSYLGLGETYTRLEQWDRGRKFGELGMQRVGEGGIPDATVFYNDNAYSFWPYTWLAVCYFNLGDNENALRAYKQAFKVRPEPDLKRTIEHLEWAMDRQRILHNGIDLAAGLMRRNEPLKGLNVLAALPAGAEDDPNVARMRSRIGQEVAHLQDDATYKNLYFTQSEHNDPLDDGTTDEAIAQFMPRLVWTLRRLKAIGAKKVLDVGIGDATPAFYLARHGIQVVGIDVDVRRVKDANWNAVKAGFQTMQVLELGDNDGDEEIPERLELPLAKPDSPAQFLFCPPGQITPQVQALGPFDAVLALELIEHVPDPDATLALCEQMAPVVLVSTPDGAFDGPQEINHGHVRAWSQRDLTRLLVPRGRLTEIHKVPRFAGEQSTLVAEYVAGETLAGAPVTIWCPNTKQEWTPDSIHTGGIGGSETAVIRVAEELAARGKRVTVYAECEGVWSGVRYALVENFMPQPCELFVSWRTIGPAPMMREFARHRFVWCHDVHAGAITEDQLEGVTLLALSEWHKRFLTEQYPTAQIVVTGNGIDPERFERDVERVPHRMIYAQSPDRGLDQVLQLFPRIREKYADATLEVFYGFEMARARHPQFIAELEQLAQQPGVTLHGRVDQDRLAEEYLKADVLLYPATMPDGQPFMETYCISVVEALAAGCWPITADHGALREINRGGGFFRPPVYDEALFQLFAFWDRRHMAQEHMRDHGHPDPLDLGLEARDGKFGRRWAREQTWAKVAEQWLTLLARDEVDPEAVIRAAFAD